MYQSLAEASDALDNSPFSDNINPMCRQHIINEMFSRGISPQSVYSEFRDYHVWIKPENANE